MDLVQQVQELCRKHIGSLEFAAILDAARQKVGCNDGCCFLAVRVAAYPVLIPIPAQVTGVRAERKRKTTQAAVSNPAVVAQRRIKKNVLKRDSRKRKIERYKQKSFGGKSVDPKKRKG